MSIKSLLQLILLLLIFFLIGGIYFLYFYSGPVKKEDVINNSLNKTNNEVINQDELLNLEVLDEVNTKKNKIKNQDKNIKIIDKKLNTETDSLKKIENLTKEIEYVTSNKEGDVFKIFAQYGKTNIKNSSILDLENVDGVITSNKRSDVYIKSDYAKYNYDNKNAEFYSNVEIKYDNKIITCENLDLQIDKNYAIAYNNVEINDNKSLMKAQTVKLNLITKDININSDEKVKVITK